MDQGADTRKRYAITVEDACVRIRVEPGEVVDVGLVLTIIKDLYSLEAYRFQKRVSLVDFRGCRGNLGYEGMQEIRAYIRAHFDPAWSHRHAAIVTDSELGYGLARMFEAVTQEIPVEVRVFRDLEQAGVWVTERAG